MAVNLPPPEPGALHPVAGWSSASPWRASRRPIRKDLLVVRLRRGSAVAGVFTRNRFCAAPVLVCRQEPEERHPGAGREHRQRECGHRRRRHESGARRSAANAWRAWRKCKAGEVLPFSTGVIMEPLPVERHVAGLPRRSPRNATGCQRPKRS
jgi:glutamate N-acetyltransferase/amino-acid N-acetyltransferase